MPIILSVSMIKYELDEKRVFRRKPTNIVGWFCDENIFCCLVSHVFFIIVVKIPTIRGTVDIF